MDGRRFRIEAGCRVRKFLRHSDSLSDLSRKVLSLVTFLYSPLRGSPFGPAPPFAPSAQCTSKESNSPSGESSELKRRKIGIPVRKPAQDKPANHHASGYPKPMTTDPIDLALIGGTGIYA